MKNSSRCKNYEMQISVSINKFYWNTDLFIHLIVVYGCFHATVAALISGNRDPVTRKTEAFNIWTFAVKIC